MRSTFHPPENRRGPLRAAIIPSIILLAALGFAGCEESVDFRTGSDYPYTIWGFMNSGADTQYVRVFEVSDELIPDSDRIDAEVRSIDLTTGERREWSYRKVRFDSLIVGHVFWAPFRAENNHRYRLEVVRSDGEMSSVEVIVPDAVEYDVDDEADGVNIPVEIRGEVPNLVGVRVIYRAINVPPANTWPPGMPVHPPVLFPVTVDHTEDVEPMADGYRLDINMFDDFKLVKDEFFRNCLITGASGSAPNIWLQRIVFTAVVADSSWRAPGGRFDPDVLGVPGTMSNVENGYGFFGAGHGIRHYINPTILARRAAGYDFAARCGGIPSDREECLDPPIPCVGENPTEFWESWLR